MDEKKILIVNLSKGLVGENNANLLGSMLVTKIYLAAMSRASATSSELKNLPNFYLYVDEFQSFANKSFADILSEARKYKLGLNITHQYIEQMAEEVRAAVFGNVGTMIAFRVGSFDAEVLEKEFAPVFTMEDIVNLGLYQIYLKLMIDQVASQPFSATTLPRPLQPEISFRDEVLEMSRKNFAYPKGEVEKAIKEWHSPEQNSQIRNPKSPPASPREAWRAGEIRNEKVEIRKEKPEQKKVETRFEQPKPKEQEKISREPQNQENKKTLAKAIEEAMKDKQNPKSEIRNLKQEIKPETKETISLQELKREDKNKNKEPTLENKNALKEALQKVNRSQIIDNSKKEEIKPASAKSSGVAREVPEETLRKILKGE